MNIALNSKIFSSCSEAFIEPQNPVEPGLFCYDNTFHIEPTAKSGKKCCLLIAGMAITSWLLPLSPFY